MMQNKKKSFDLLLFDLGGILVKLSGAPRMMELTRGRLTVEDLWSRWLDSPAVKAFESGRSSGEIFAMAMIDEFDLEIDPSRFMEEFADWSKDLYPGARRLLSALGASYTLASLSNTNAIHWRYFHEVLRLPDYFHHNFPSHETGYLKPEREAYLNVIRALSVKPERVLFLDDLAVNVESARATGLTAFQVKGIDQVISCLRTLGLLEDPQEAPFDQRFPVAGPPPFIETPSKLSLA